MFVAFEPPGRLKFEGYCKDETPVSYKFYMLELSSKEHHQPHYADGFFLGENNAFGSNSLQKQRVLLIKIGKNYDFVRERGCPYGNCRSQELSGLLIRKNCHKWSQA